MNDQTSEIKELIKKYCNKKYVLDNGCGNLGYSIIALESGASHICALDIKIPYNKIKDTRLVFYNFDAQKLPFADSTFDVILCIGLIEYINMNKGIDEMKRVLKEEGIIIFQEKDSRGLKHKLYGLKCKLINKTPEGFPHNYRALMRKLKVNFNIISYTETKPRHNFLVVLQNGTNIKTS